MESELDILQSYVDGSTDFFTECLTIRDHNTSSLLPFDMNYGQRVLHEIIEKQKRETGGCVRILLLKSRRFGGSTYVEGRFYQKTSLHENKNTFIVGHEEESTKTLFSMAKLFNERNPLKPETLASNSQELKFDTKSGDGLKSEYRLATAKNTGAGLSQGIHMLHASEESSWPKNAPELLLGLFQCVPDPPSESEIIRESTAHGYGNTFQEGVFDAYASGKHPYFEKDGSVFAWSNPDTEWVLVFIPWFAIEKYSMPIPKDRMEGFLKRIGEKTFDVDLEKWMPSEASVLQKKFGLSLEQLYWREWAINNKCNKSVDKFHQEYPSTVEEAFLSTGTNHFSKTLCDELEQNIKKPIFVGSIRRTTGKARLRRSEYGEFTIWEQPEKGRSYFLTVDVAGGMKKLIQKSSDKEPDKTCIDVWDRKSGEQVAQWHGHRDHDMVADLASMIGEFYASKNRRGSKLPTACVELNNHGYTVVDGLRREQYPQYKNENGELGWLTNKRTKPLMMDGLREAVRDGVLKINSKTTVSEMRTFIEEHGHFEAAPGCNDDTVVTAAMAQAIINLIPRDTNKKSSHETGFQNLNDNKPGTGYFEIWT